MSANKTPKSFPFLKISNEKCEKSIKQTIDIDLSKFKSLSGTAKLRKAQLTKSFSLKPNIGLNKIILSRKSKSSALTYDCGESEARVALMNNNNWVVDNWFKTWPTREKSNTKDTLNVTPQSYEKVLKNNIISLDVITDLCEDGKYMLSTLRSGKLKNKRCVDTNIEMSDEIKLESLSDKENISLDVLLESLPLIYNPCTRQLQIVKLRSVKNKNQKSLCGMHLNDEDCEDCENLQPKFHCIEDIEQNKTHILQINEDPFENNIRNNHFSWKTDSQASKCDSECAPPSTLVSHDVVVKLNEGSLQLCSTNTSLSHTDENSFYSSTTDSLITHSNPDSTLCLKDNEIQRMEDTKLHKKKGLTSFLTRNLFSRKGKDDKQNRISMENSTTHLSCDTNSTLSQLSSSNTDITTSSWRIFSRGDQHSLKLSEAHKHDMQAGSVGLIMEHRPGSLPAKTADEEERHKQEYDNIVSAAKKREMKEAKERRKMQDAMLKQEKLLSESVHMWKNVFIPKWNAMHTHKKCHDLWWAGLPSCVRGKIWKLAIGNDLNISPHLYSILVQRSMEKLVTLTEKGAVNSFAEDSFEDSTDQESTLNLIRLDVSRTFPHLCIFQKGGPFHDPLHNILGAYVCYRPDVGYVQGMSFLAATLLLNMEESEAFVAFANLLNRPAHMAFFSVDQQIMQAYYRTFEDLLKENIPQLAEHLNKLTVSPDMYFLDWVLSVFARSLPLDVAARVWDIYLRDGEEFLFRAAVGILKYFESELLAQECTAMTAQFLTRLPEDLCSDELFKVILTIQTSTNKKTLKQILDRNVFQYSNFSPNFPV